MRASWTGVYSKSEEVYLLNYIGESHGLRKRQNQIDYTRRMQEFFEHFLKGTPTPEWMAHHY